MSVTPYQADAFVDSIGVNIHAGFGLAGSSDLNPANAYQHNDIAALLTWLGVRYVRDNANFSSDALTRTLALDQQLATLGIQFIRFASNSTGITRLTTAGYVQPIAVEAANEPDLTNPSTWYATAQSAQSSLYAASKALWPSVPVLTPSVGNYANYAAAGDIGSTYVDGNSVHIYNTPGVRAENNTSLSVPTTPADFDSWRVLAPGKPMWITEHGYPHGNVSDGPAVWIDERAAACLIPENLLYFFTGAADTTIGSLPYPTQRGGFGGAQKTFLYELLDQYPVASDKEYRFGLFTANGRPKLTARILRNMIALLSDVGSAFTPTPLNITLSSGPVNLNQYLVFQKRDGSYWIVFWARSDAVTTPYGNTSLTPRTGTVKPDVAGSIAFSFGQTFTYANVYRPLYGVNSILSANAASSLAVTTANDIQVIRLANTPPAEARTSLIRGALESRLVR